MARRRSIKDRAEEAEAMLRLERARLQTSAIKRQRKMLSTYAAAEKNRLTDDWRARNRSADQAIVADTPTLNARARQITRDNEHAGSVADAYRRRVVGIGISPRAASRDPKTGEERTAFNKSFNTWYDRWAYRPRYVDLERRKSIVEVQGLAITEWVQVGQAFAVMGYQRRREMIGLVLQMFEWEQLAWDLTQAPDSTNEVRGGIEIDKFGAAAAFWVYTQGHPYEEFGTAPSRWTGRARPSTRSTRPSRRWPRRSSSTTGSRAAAP